jgi:hypothetical protein
MIVTQPSLGSDGAMEDKSSQVSDTIKKLGWGYRTNKVISSTIYWSVAKNKALLQ